MIRNLPKIFLRRFENVGPAYRQHRSLNTAATGITTISTGLCTLLQLSFVGCDVSLDTLQVILEMMFPAKSVSLD